MSTNYYLRNHIYKGYKEARLDTGNKFDCSWAGAFDEVPSIMPFLRVIDHMSPLIHVCLLGGVRICWVMLPDHVRVLANSYVDKKVFFNEYDEELTGREFLEKINDYDDFVCKFGEHFC